LSADNDVWVIVSYEVIDGVRFAFGVVCVETDDFGIWKNFVQFGLEVFGAEAFVEDVSIFAGGTAGGNWIFLSAGVADELVVVGVEVEGQETVGAEGLPAAAVADGKGA
jgi:hypothetical protein